MKTILVTGAAGFIGFHVSKRLLAEGHRVIGLDNINDYYDVNLKYSRLKELGIIREEAAKWEMSVSSLVYPNFSFIRMNIEDRQKLPTLFSEERFEKVIHLAAQAGVRYSLENPQVYIDSNIVGFLNILECCRHNKIKHLIFASSSSVYGANENVPFTEEDRVDYPVSLYAATKKSNELMAYTYSHLYKVPISGLRFFTVYGPWGRPDMAPMLFASAITQNRAIDVFNNGDMSRDFTFIDDVVEGIHVTLNNPPLLTQGSPFYQLMNIGNGSPVSLKRFIEVLERELGKSAKKNLRPMQPGDVPQTWADTTKLNLLGYSSSTPIEKGVKAFIKWFRKEYSK